MTVVMVVSRGRHSLEDGVDIEGRWVGLRDELSKCIEFYFLAHALILTTSGEVAPAYIRIRTFVEDRTPPLPRRRRWERIR